MAKKTLLELMVEAGVKWPEGAEYAAQDKRDSRVNFYKDGKPEFYIGLSEWLANECAFLGDEYGVLLPSLCRNWHQTIVTREQYEKAMTEQPDQPPTIEAQPCVSATPYTIEQRIAELQDMERNLAEFRAKLTDDLHALGLTWKDNVVVADEPKQPVITDWHDLRVGDVIWVGTDENSSLPAGEYQISEVDGSDAFPIALLREGNSWWISLNGHRQWHFIRRP